MPTLDQLAKTGSEHGEQTALFAWAAMATMRGFAAAWDDNCYTVAGYAATNYGEVNALPQLKWFHAIPNGGNRGDDEKSRAISGGTMKAEGQKKGVLDTFWPCPRGPYAGLYIEMKKPAARPVKADAAGGVTPEQKEFITFVAANHYAVNVCYTWREAAETLQRYWNGQL